MKTTSTKFENRQSISSVDIELPGNKEPIAEHIVAISQALRSEQEAIREYQAILSISSLPLIVRKAVEEIINDEKDHLVVLASLVNEEIIAAFPNNGDAISQEPGGNDADIDGAFKPKTESKKVTESDKIFNYTRISSDGINNTIKYEINSAVEYDEDFILRAHSEVINAIQMYNNAFPDRALEENTFGAGNLSLIVTLSNEEKISDDVVSEIFDYIINKCKHVWLA